MRLQFPAALIVATAAAMAWSPLPAAAQQTTPVAAEQQAASGQISDGPQGADERGERHRLTPEDRRAFLDARIAAVHAGLALMPEQEKLWPAIETVVRDMRAARDKLREADAPTKKGDLIGRLKRMADRAKLRGEGLARLAETASPLWNSLDSDQKWRLHVLLHSMHHRHLAMIERDGRKGSEQPDGR